MENSKTSLLLILWYIIAPVLKRKFYAFLEVFLFDQKLWNHIKVHIQKDFPGKVLHSVLNVVRLESKSLNGQKSLIFHVPSTYHQKILQNNLPKIQEKIKNMGLSSNIFHIQNNLSLSPEPIKKLLPTSPTKGAMAKNTPQNRPKSFFTKWTFSSFIEGPNNRFALSVAKSIAKNPFKPCSNPFFIYGPSGIGKTHLLHAIGNSLQTHHPSLKALYLPAERFFNDFINHVRKNEMADFRKKYRKNINVLLIDDVQILGKGESSQEEFFHTYESLKQAGTHIILACDQKPKNIKGLKARIKTRFEGGVIADISTPDQDTKMAIIKNKVKGWALPFPEEVINFLASVSIQSIREIEGHLNKIKMFCELQNMPLSMELAKKLFSKDFAKQNKLSHESGFKKQKPQELIQFIQKLASQHFSLSVAQIKSQSRKKSLVLARNHDIFIAREDFKLSLKNIAEGFNRDHSTILNSLKNIEKSDKNNPDLKKLRQVIHKSLPLNVENLNQN